MKQCDFVRTFPLLFPNYRYEAAVFFQYCLEHELEYNIDAVRAYQLSIPRQLKFGTYNKKLAAAKKVVEQWVQKDNPEDFASTVFMLKTIKGMKRADKTVPSDRWHTPEQILIMQEKSGKKTRALICFLSCTGVRIAEAAGIRLEDITLTGEVYSIRINGKGNKERVIEVDPDVVDKVQTVFNGESLLFETRNGDQYDPDILSNMVRVAGKKIGIRSSAHRLRHSFATQFLKDNPGKFKELSLHLGHSTIQITMDTYAHNKMEMEDLKKTSRAFKQGMQVYGNGIAVNS